MILTQEYLGYPRIPLYWTMMASRNDCPGQSPVEIFQLRSGVLEWPAHHHRFPHFLRSMNDRVVVWNSIQQNVEYSSMANPCKPRCWFTETSSFLKHPVFTDVNRPCLSCSTLHMIPDANALAEDPFDAWSWMGQCLGWVRDPRTIIERGDFQTRHGTNYWRPKIRYAQIVRLGVS